MINLYNFVLLATGLFEREFDVVHQAEAMFFVFLSFLLGILL